MASEDTGMVSSFFSKIGLSFGSDKDKENGDKDENDSKRKQESGERNDDENETDSTTALRLNEEQLKADKERREEVEKASIEEVRS